MDIVTKDFVVEDAGESADYPNGAFSVILSAPTKDRDGEIVDAKAFEPLPDHITFDTDHSMTCDSVVGSGVPSYAADGTLRVKGGYCADARSQVIRQKVKDGHIRTTSVTFMAAERVKDGKGVPHVVRAELLNGTFTPVPSNRETVVLSAKSILAHDLTVKAGARNSKADAETIQAIHDASTSLGAVCMPAEKTAGKRTVPAEAKSIIGSLEAQRDRVADALEDAYPDAYAYVRGVLPTNVVFDVWNGGECETWQQDYTDDGSVVTLTGDPVEVDVMEVVLPDADAATEPAEKSHTNVDDALTERSADTTTDDAAAAQAAAESAVESADAEEVRKALAHAIENAAHFAFGG